MKGISLYLSESQDHFKTTYKINGLDLFSDFVFNDMRLADGSVLQLIRSYRHYKIGTGVTVRANQRGEAAFPSLKVFASGSALTRNEQTAETY
jgi:hypothetical protein